MIFSPIQDGCGANFPVSCGRMRIVENLRPCKEGYYEGLREAREVMGHGVGMEPVGVDRRDGMINVLACNGRKLAWNGSFDQTGSFHSRYEEICELSAEVEECVQAGAYVALRLKGGVLWFLLWEADLHTYTSLGSFPELPVPVIKVAGKMEYEASLAGIEFKGAVADMRQGVPEYVVEQTSSVVREVWDESVKAMKASGRWVQPVMVRIGYRLWDGTLYALSDAMEIDGMGGYVGLERVVLDLVSGTGGYTGTVATKIRVPSYVLSVAVPSLAMSAWSRVIRYVEVYVTEEQNPVLAGMGKVTYSQTSHQLGVTLPGDDVDVLRASMGGQPVARVVRTESVNTMAGELRNPGEKVPYTVVETVAPPRREVDSICGHGAFLHVACGTEIITMKRGNPFVEASRTDAGYPVKCVGAQPVGGGAYTRQYLYVFTDGGTLGLVHDASGVHCNCRPVGDFTLMSKDCIVATDGGLWVLSAEGSLVHLRDSRAEVVMRGVRGGRGLAWHRGLGELWIIMERGDVAVLCEVDPKRDLRGYMRTAKAAGNGEGYLNCSGEIIAYRRGGIMVALYGEEESDMPRIAGRWETGDGEYSGSATSLLEVDAQCEDGEAFSIGVDAMYGRRGDWMRVADVNLRDSVKTARLAAVRFCSLDCGQSRARIVIEGTPKRIYSCRLRDYAAICYYKIRRRK